VRPHLSRNELLAVYVPILLVFALALLSLVAMPAYAVAFGLAAARLFRWE
jgi:hypothetical protein